jgi:hypothetical protein
MPWAQVAPTTHAQDGRADPIKATISVGANKADPIKAMMPGVYIVTRWCMAPDPVCLGTQPQVTWFHPPGSQVPRIQGVARLLLSGSPGSPSPPIN